ncbi:MAG: indolepyruvate oxidoreductase subunit beta [Deltaproteobacteria bacterium]|nr:indolepyruvate oxidoreductase subunit beta [Deltaproteobacteria bacterium]
MADVTLLPSDPYNLIIAGVGGQGNILTSKVIGTMLVRKGLMVTIGESFGMSQRGGSVCSHLRISSRDTYSPMVPPNAAHMILGLEPIEMFRLLCQHGNPDVNVIFNTRPVHPVSVIIGNAAYPKIEDMQQWMKALTARTWMLDATDEAIKLGRAIYANIILIGALAGVNVLPVDREAFEAVIAETMPQDKVEVNLRAFDMGQSMVASASI